MAQVTLTKGHSAASEAYRTLRTNIQFMTLDRQARTILIIGAHPGCGKTTTVTNLSFTLAQAGSSVLLVDTDLRRPRLNQIFRCANSYGLTNLLIDQEVKFGAARHKTTVKNLEVVPSGPIPPNPAELLSSRRMHMVLKEFQNHYDYVLLDSPPLLNIADASILAQLADATVLVVAYGQTTREEAVMVHQQLKLAKANLIGVVINGIPPNQDPYGYYGYYYQEEPKRHRKKKFQVSEDFDIDFNPDEVYEDL